MLLKRKPNVVELPRRARHQRHPRWEASFHRLETRLADLELALAGVQRGTFMHTLQMRMRWALVLSVAVHLAVIFGVVFKLPALPPPPDQKTNLEVVLVNAKSATAPTTADALAQHNLDGGGDTEHKRRAQSPLPAARDQKSDADVKQAEQRARQLEQEAQQLMTQAMAPSPVESVPPQQNDNAQAEPQAKPLPSATDILQRSHEIARLEGKIAREMDLHQQRPQRRFIGARTREFRFARYIEDWREKIQRIGDLNYPQAARDQRLIGNLVVTVAIKSDGTVEYIEINRPSGHRVLDEAARRIVELAAPFAAFPPDIAKDTDVLHITRTWTFTPADRFISDQ
jgi:protein TonB